MAEVPPDQSIYIQVLTQKWQGAELENAGLTAHIMAQNRTIEEQGGLIASQQEEIESLKKEVAAKPSKAKPKSDG